jgi:hypothetical protein
MFKAVTYVPPVPPPAQVSVEVPETGFVVELAGKFVAFFVGEATAKAFAAANKGATVVQVTLSKE